MSWNRDVAAARLVQGKVILATKCEQVITSRLIPASTRAPARWEGLATGEEPVAWQPWPTHPGVSDAQ